MILNEGISSLEEGLCGDQRMDEELENREICRKK